MERPLTSARLRTNNRGMLSDEIAMPQEALVAGRSDTAFFRAVTLETEENRPTKPVPSSDENQVPW